MPVLFYHERSQLEIELRPLYGDDDIYTGYAEAAFRVSIPPSEQWFGRCKLADEEMNSFAQGLVVAQRHESVAKLTCGSSAAFHLTIRPARPPFTFLINGGMIENGSAGHQPYQSFEFEIPTQQVIQAAESLAATLPAIPRKRPPGRRPPGVQQGPAWSRQEFPSTEDCDPYSDSSCGFNDDFGWST